MGFGSVSRGTSKLIMLRFLAIAVFVGVISANKNVELYEDTASWGGECATGMMQSPIDLPSDMKAENHAPLNYRNYFNGHFNKHIKGSVINNGISVVWNVNPNSHFHLHGGNMWKYKNPSIRRGPFGGSTHSHAYYLWKIDFHWGEPGNPSKGSEHTIDGEMAPLEMQMVHIEDRYIDTDGKVMWNKARKVKHGVAILSILFYIDNNKPQNQEPLSQLDDSIWEMHWPGANAKRALHKSMDLVEVEEKQLEHDHELDIKSLQYAFSQLKESESETKETRAPHMKRIKMTLNVGAFIRKAIRNGADKTMSTYWSYMGSLTTPGCSEAVTWVVFHRTLPIAQVQANAFASLYTNNYRESRPAAPEHELKYLIHDCLTCNCHCNV